ncbi:ABC1 family-domain-containing protein [Terfezia claveryi]|nr:ABC1 family-domain-containing protein [Terfezia claveryi]
MRALRSNLQRASNSTRPFSGKPPQAQVPILPRIRVRGIHTESSLWTCNRSVIINKASKRRRRNLILGLVAGGATLGALRYGWQDLKHFVNAAERAGRVASGLVLCINDYRVTLKTIEDQTDSEEEQERLLSACHQRCADRTYKVLEKNGSIFIKLGQHLAAMGYLLPPEWTKTFIPLQDKCPVSSYASIEKMICDETGCAILDLFEEFDRTPIGAASLAQVHRAKLKGSGQEVAVKLQHPALAEWIPLDIALTRFAFRNIKFFFPEYPLEWLSDEIESSLPQELNFTMEASNIERMRNHFSVIQPKTCPLVVPTVVWSKPRVLVMEFLPGKRLDDLAWLDEVGISRDEVSAALARIFNEMVFGDRAPLHCDPHGGNLAIRINDKIPGWSRSQGRGFDIILYDHGLYRDIPGELRRNYAKLWLAVLDGDEARMRKWAKEVAGIKDEQFPLFASAITGRDYTVLVHSESRGSGGGIVNTPRTSTEKAAITSALMTPTDVTGHGQGAMLAQLMQLLAHVPPIILLILKTNDLTRSLDESLHTSPEAGVRVWLILARYCARTVFEEEMENVRRLGLRSLKGWVGWVGALWGWWRVEVRLRVFEGWMRWRRLIGKTPPLIGDTKGVNVEVERVEERKVGEVVKEKEKEKVPEPELEMVGVNIADEVKKFVNGGGAKLAFA